MTLLCLYCPSRPAAAFHETSNHVYAGRDYGSIWQCPGCGAYVGTHPDGSPLGRLANHELRQHKMAVHAMFDPLWQNWKLAYPDMRAGDGKTRRLMRARAYAWLAEQMGMTAEDCHVGNFDVDQCRAAVSIVRTLKPTAATVRAWAKEKQNGDSIPTQC